MSGEVSCRASARDTQVNPVEGHIFDAIVVGGGPGGCAAAIAMAQRSLNVLLIEKDEYPRAKVCGDGLTPRAVRMLRRLRVPVGDWHRHVGLRVYGGSVNGMELPWPTLKELPDYGMVCRRDVFDDVLAGHAIDCGVHILTKTTVASLIDDEQGVYRGATTTDGRNFYARVIVVADGNSSRLARKIPGCKRNLRRPMGVAVRTYYRTERPSIDYLESWLELWNGKPGESNLMPGYGWLFDLGDGTVNVGIGVLNSTKAFGKIDYRQQLKKWVATLPPEWGISEATRIEPIKGSALPMGIHRKLVVGNCLIVGDAAGMVSPFNGEGISYAMEAGEMAAEAIAEALRRGIDTDYGREALSSYQQSVKKVWGGYFRLGTIFVRLIGSPVIMRLCVTYGLPRKRLMCFVHKLLSQLTDTRGGGIDDRFINFVNKLAPSV